ncbi:hypothetical protein D3C72_1258240 [compost metagenome]
MPHYIYIIFFVDLYTIVLVVSRSAHISSPDQRIGAAVLEAHDIPVDTTRITGLPCTSSTAAMEVCALCTARYIYHRLCFVQGNTIGTVYTRATKVSTVSKRSQCWIKFQQYTILCAAQRRFKRIATYRKVCRLCIAGEVYIAGVIDNNLTTGIVTVVML